MIRAPRLLVIACLAFAASGCGRILRDILPKPRPALESYRLLIPAPDVAGVASRAGPLPGRLSIAPYVTRGIYNDPNIAFRVDEVRFGSYPSREWAIPLRHMLGEATEIIMTQYPLTQEPAAFDPRAPRTYEYQWRGRVIEFEEVNRGLTVLAAVHLEAELVRSANDSVIWTGAERVERAVPEPSDSMPRVVETLSALTVEAITRLVERARTAVTGAASSAVPTAAAAPPPE